MSYVRWSSDGWQSDVYCYESDRGFETHVASFRVVFAEPPPPELPIPQSMADWDAWWKRQAIEDAMYDQATKVKIGGPYDGASFTDESEAAMGRRLAMLRAAGYRVPEGLIEELIGGDE